MAFIHLLLFTIHTKNSSVRAVNCQLSTVNCQLSIIHCPHPLMGRWDNGTRDVFEVNHHHLLPMMAVYGLNPSILLPSHHDATDSALCTIVLQSPKVITRECGSQLVEHGVIHAISLTFVSRIHILFLQRLTERLDLLLSVYSAIIKAKSRQALLSCFAPVNR